MTHAHGLCEYCVQTIRTAAYMPQHMHTGNANTISQKGKLMGIIDYGMLQYTNAATALGVLTYSYV